VGLVPTQPFHLGAAVVMLGIGAAGAIATLGVFRRRDLLGAWPRGQARHGAR
jgi:hypothetical protein